MAAVELGSEEAIAVEADVAPVNRNKSRTAISIRERRVLLAVADLVTGMLAFPLAFLLLHPPAAGPVPFLVVLASGMAWVFGLFLVDGYGFQIPTNRLQSAIAVAKAAPVAGIVAISAFFIQPYVVSRPVIVVSTALGVVLLVGMRTTLARLLLHESLATRAVLFGPSQPAEEVMGTLAAARFECQIVASLIRGIDTSEDRPQPLTDLFLLLEAQSADELIVTTNESRFLPGLAEECLSRGIRVVGASTLVERYMGRVPLENVDVNWYLALPDNDLWERPYALARRLSDLLLSALICIPFVILLPALALAIRLDSEGPVFHIQRRVGQRGKEFNLLKLRTMRADAESQIPRFAEHWDPRVTRVGRFLRASRLDELPQILNILLGQMSFIGPRPERPEFMSVLEAAIPHFRSRLLVKPGLTGWAQVKGGYASTIPEMVRKLEYDLYYIKNRSLRLDLQILALTFVTVVGFSGR